MPPAFVIGLSLAVFLAVMMAGSFLYWGWRSRQEHRAREIARRLGTGSDEEADSLFHGVTVDPMVESLGSIGVRLDELTRQAGVAYPLQGLLSRMGIGALLGTVVLFLLLRSPLALGGVLFGLVPVILLSMAADARARRVSEQLPEALDLISRSLQAGHGLADAMRLCAEEMQAPLSVEFARIYEEHNLGRDFRECLQNLSKRNARNFDLKLFVSSVLLQRDTGGNLIEILNNISQTVRDRFVFEAKVSALTSEARISAIILCALPFILLLLIMFMRPGYHAPMVEDPLGVKISFGAIGLFSTGIFVMVRMTKVDV
jgi:tight adherence protein B